MTVIIPFLNEGIEVGETIKSIKSHTTIPFDIILINDASTDGYNYGQIAQMYDCIYHEHKARVGVTSLRDTRVRDKISMQTVLTALIFRHKYKCPTLYCPSNTQLYQTR